MDMNDCTCYRVMLWIVVNGGREMITGDWGDRSSGNDASAEYDDAGSPALYTADAGLPRLT